MTGRGGGNSGTGNRDSGTGWADRMIACLPAACTRSYAGKVAVALAVVVLLLSTVGLGSYLHIQDHVVSDATADLESSATSRASSLAQWRATTETKTVTIAAAQVYANGTTAEVRQYLETVAAMESAQGRSLHYVATATGEPTITASTDSALEGQSPSAIEPAWTAPIESALTRNGGPGGATLSTAYADGDGYSMAFVSPVSGGDGALVLVARVPTDRLADGREGFQTQVLTADGETLSEGGALAVSQSGVEAAAAGQTTTVEAGGSVAAYAPVSGLPWVVMTGAETEALYATSRAVRWSLVAFVGTAVVSLGAVSLVFGRHTIAPLVRLRDQTEAMEDGDLGVDLSTDRRDEIGRLYDSFRSMRDTLRSQIRQAQSAREEAERSTRELQRQNERLDEFASTLSHDLRNPLTVARGHVELLSTRLSDPETDPTDLQTHVQKLEDAHDRIESIIDDVLTLTRKGASVEETAPVPLEGLVTDAWDNIDSKNASIEVTESRTIDADRTRLLRAFENLFRNAIDHVGPDVTITVGMTDHGFYVADDGPGIPTEQVDDIFEYGHTTSEAGTGLGLSIVKTIAEAHGWRLYIDTTYPDGAMFVFADVFGEDEPDWYGTEFEWVSAESDD